MPNFLEYNPEQAYLLPPSVRDVLGEDHLCFFVHRAVEKLDLQEFEAGYSDDLDDITWALLCQSNKGGRKRLAEVGMGVRGAGEKIDAAMRELPGVNAGPHRFGGTEYRVGRREIGHVHGDALVDIPFTKKVREELVAVGRAERHHILPESGWVSVWLREAGDVERAVELLKLSFETAGERRLREKIAGAP